MQLSPFNIPAAHHFFAGRWVPSSAQLDGTDPSDGTPLATIGPDTATDIDAAVDAAENAGLGAQAGAALAAQDADLTIAATGRIVTDAAG